MRFLRWLVRTFFVTLAAVTAFLLLAQEKMLYHPRRYPHAPIAAFGGDEHRVKPLTYTTSQGPQVGYYMEPLKGRPGGAKGPIWVAFCGNGSLALEWLHVIGGSASPGDAFLLVDYPGYGACAGRPTPQTIQESADKSLDALAARLGASRAELEPRLNVLGHSLGAANALAFASTHPVSRVVLVAPFSSMRDMAQRSVGWPLCYLLRHNFDNRARMREIAGQPRVPAIEIFAGTHDDLIPFTMGRELASLIPGARFEAIDGAGHNDILEIARDKILDAMRQD